MEKLQELFTKIGFSNAEAKVLDTLVSQGPLKAGEIIKKTLLQSSTIYHVLDSLKEKGLVSITIKNNIKYYNAVLLEEIIEYIDEKGKDLEEIKRNLFNLKKSISKSRKNTSEVKMYEGYKGFLSAYREAINSLKKEKEIYVFILSRYSGNAERVELIKDIMRRLRKEKKIKLKVIVSEIDKRTIGKDHEKAYKTEVKYINSEVNYFGVNHIIGDFVLIGAVSDQPIGILIKDKIIAQSYKNIFLNLWKIAKH